MYGMVHAVVALFLGLFLVFAPSSADVSLPLFLSVCVCLRLRQGYAAAVFYLSRLR